MQIILLSGGSGTRLWPLSNDARSKQFLKLLPIDGSDRKESMIQRVVRQLKESGINASVTVAANSTQRDSVISQLGETVDTVLEPSRRNTFPAICLACEYLKKVKKCNDEEEVIVMPCDPYTDTSYFDTINKIGSAIKENVADLIVMGIKPTYPSTKYGYILPFSSKAEILKVRKFVEKPSVFEAETLINEGALWNGGVFGFKLKYILEKSKTYNSGNDFASIKDNFDCYPKISFDYEVAENETSIGMIPFTGQWKDLGTWNILTDELSGMHFGNVHSDGTAKDTHIINELDIPLLCMGTKNLLIAASPDGILITEKKKSENIKDFAEELKSRPMYEERRWGSYRVLCHSEYPDGYCVLTKQLTLNPGSSISYQRHLHRDETWTFTDGEGLLIIDGIQTRISRGDTISIKKGQLHALKAITSLTFIEIQAGSNLIEEDIERFEWKW